jgi:hypothetical protein
LCNCHGGTKYLFIENEGQEGKTGPVWAWVPVEEDKEGVKEKEYG